MDDIVSLIGKLKDAVNDVTESLGIGARQLTVCKRFCLLT
jgi:hypothetical protein